MSGIADFSGEGGDPSSGAIKAPQRQEQREILRAALAPRLVYLDFERNLLALG